jgi:hypothetical protein
MKIAVRETQKLRLPKVINRKTTKGQNRAQVRAQMLIDTSSSMRL